MEDKRTIQQNKALHKWFELLARELRENGYDMKTVMPKVIDIIPTKENVKELIWRPVQMAMFSKHSTTELLKKKEIDLVFDVICKALGEMGVVVPAFPSDIIYLEENGKRNSKEKKI
jgi:hypothetical protein